MAQGMSTRQLIQRLLLLVLVMFGFGFALVPIYEVMCQAFGINGKTAGAYQGEQSVDEARQVHGAEERALRQGRAQLRLEHGAQRVFEQGELVGEVRVERHAVDGGALGDVLHGDGLEALLGQQRGEGLHQ